MLELTLERPVLEGQRSSTTSAQVRCYSLQLLTPDLEKPEDAVQLTVLGNEYGDVRGYVSSLYRAAEVRAGADPVVPRQ
jgi:hypothetical protein